MKDILMKNIFWVSLSFSPRSAIVRRKRFCTFRSLLTDRKAIFIGGVPASASLNRQVLFANANTGVALLNAGSGTANLTFQYLDKSGAQIGQVTRTLTANNHTAFFISQLFPSAPSTAVGTLRITSDQAVVATALLFNGAAIGTIPIFPLQ